MAGAALGISAPAPLARAIRLPRRSQFSRTVYDDDRGSPHRAGPIP